MFNSVFYKFSPIFVQDIMVSCRALLRLLIREKNNDEAFQQQIAAFENNPEALAKYHQTKLAEVLKNAKQHVPYYQQALQNKEASLENFPIISKTLVIDKADEFKSVLAPKLLVKGKTSGTTGIPITIPQELNSVLKERSFIMRMYEWAGYKKGMKSAWIRGDVIVPLQQKTAPFWRYSYFENTIMMSSFHLNKSALPAYIKAMTDYGVEVIRAYPSSITTLANYLEEEDLYYPSKLQAIITSSESLSPENKALIEKRFGCRVFDWYGLFERVAAICSCEQGRYHLLTDYAHVELEDMGDGTHEIIGTNFNNSAYPLIRYKTADYVELSDETQCPCGRPYPIIKSIKGRRADFVYHTNGTKVYSLERSARKVKGVISAQFIQEKLKEIRVNVVADKRFDEHSLEDLYTSLLSRLGADMQIDIKQVPQLERTKNGKVRQVICKVKLT